MRIGVVLLAIGAIGAIGASVLCAARAQAAGFGCPPTVMDKGAIRLSNGAVDPPWALHPFKQFELYEGDPKGAPKIHPADDVRADRIIQSWDFGKTSLARLIAVCRYSGTRQTVQSLLPTGTKRCSLTTMKTGATPPQLRCE